METHLRSILKASTWRVGGFVVTFLVSWAITRRLEMAASIGLADTAVKLVAYYAHERMWLRIPFGRTREPDFDI
jgi:uncharacterized membrane protein